MRAKDARVVVRQKSSIQLIWCILLGATMYTSTIRTTVGLRGFAVSVVPQYNYELRASEYVVNNETTRRVEINKRRKYRDIPCTTYYPMDVELCSVLLSSEDAITLARYSGIDWTRDKIAFGQGLSRYHYTVLSKEDRIKHNNNKATPLMGKWGVLGGLVSAIVLRVVCNNRNRWLWALPVLSGTCGVGIQVLCRYYFLHTQYYSLRNQCLYATNPVRVQEWAALRYLYKVTPNDSENSWYIDTTCKQE